MRKENFAAKFYIECHSTEGKRIANQGEKNE